MTLEEATALLGQAVAYTPPGTTNDETGVITAVTSRYVFVRYGTDQHSKATAAGQLRVAGGS